ncbi:uncharacterized protein LOC121045541 [Ixodes scapularis]|uniref:uncharacterized protein LOC121045541 n=1 Tax=Ixodes scapularis TaxID=6945 RepID=UPI001C38B244|nr:uncharacterized protein LOC121045541 [Ixodes scapularis]
MSGKVSVAVSSLLLVLAWRPGQAMECPAIPIPLAEAIMEVHTCLTAMSRPIKSSEYDAVQGFLMDCAEKTQQGTSNPLVFMMLACSDANYLDKTAYCMFDQEQAIFKKLNLDPNEQKVADKIFKCLKEMHAQLVQKRSKA